MALDVKIQGPNEQALTNLCQAKTAKGLVDIKFDLDLTSGPASAEIICGEVLALYAAVDAGDAKPLTFEQDL